MKCRMRKFTENEDGSANADIEYDREFYDEAVKWAEKEHPELETEDEIVNAYVMTMLNDYIEQEEKNDDKKHDGDSDSEVL